MGDATRPMASAMAMHTCASGTPELEIFRLQHPFPAAGEGHFLDAEHGRDPLPQPLSGNRQPALAVLSLGAGGSWNRSQLETMLRSQLFRLSQHTFESKFLCIFLLLLEPKHVFCAKS